MFAIASNFASTQKLRQDQPKFRPKKSQLDPQAKLRKKMRETLARAKTGLSPPGPACALRPVGVFQDPKHTHTRYPSLSSEGTRGAIGIASALISDKTLIVLCVRVISSFRFVPALLAKQPTPTPYELSLAIHRPSHQLSSPTKDGHMHSTRASAGWCWLQEAHAHHAVAILARATAGHVGDAAVAYARNWPRIARATAATAVVASTGRGGSNSRRR